MSHDSWVTNQSVIGNHRLSKFLFWPRSVWNKAFRKNREMSFVITSPVGLVSLEHLGRYQGWTLNYSLKSEEQSVIYRLSDYDVAWLSSKSFFRSISTKITNFKKTKRVFCSVFPSGSDETIVRLNRSFWQFLAIFVKSKMRASAPSRGRIYVVSDLLYLCSKD